MREEGDEWRLQWTHLSTQPRITTPGPPAPNSLISKWHSSSNGPEISLFGIKQNISLQMLGLLQNILLLMVITSPASPTVTSPGFVSDKFIFREEISAVTPRHRRKHYRNAAIQHSWGIWLCRGLFLPGWLRLPCWFICWVFRSWCQWKPSFINRFFWHESINLIKN